MPTAIITTDITGRRTVAFVSEQLAITDFVHHQRDRDANGDAGTELGSRAGEDRSQQPPRIRTKRGADADLLRRCATANDIKA